MDIDDLTNLNKDLPENIARNANIISLNDHADSTNQKKSDSETGELTCFSFILH